MSLVGTRSRIMVALSTVAGVNAHEKRPAAMADGDAWPMLGPMTREAGTAFLATWGVRVFVPQDEVTAAEWWDAHWPEIFFALEQVASVQRATPAEIQTEAGSVLVYDIQMVAEE